MKLLHKIKNWSLFLLPIVLLCFTLALTGCKDEEQSMDEICDNGIDDDNNGFTDCNDIACPCEICDNGIDDDNDGFTDCNDVDCNNDPSCVSQGSDVRLKTNIESLNYGLQELLQLNTKNYEYISEPNVKRFGLLAQETQAVLPEIVSVNDANKMLQIRYIDLVAILINATQQQQALIEENRALIECLQEYQHN